MGAAAENRFKAKGQRETRELFRAMQEREDLQRAADRAVKYDELARVAMDAVVDPRGMCAADVLGAKDRRGWAKKHAAAVDAHNEWVNSDSGNVFVYLQASLKRAEANVALAVFAYRGFWRMPFDNPFYKLGRK